jgi:hypothetical protein
MLASSSFFKEPFVTILFQISELVILVLGNLFQIYD